MNAAGIDVSSRKSTVAVLRPFGEVVKLPFDVRHSAEDLAALAAQLKSIEGETRVVMEHTGRYYESVAKVLHEAGLYARQEQKKKEPRQRYIDEVWSSLNP